MLPCTRARCVASILRLPPDTLLMSLPHFHSACLLLPPLPFSYFISHFTFPLLFFFFFFWPSIFLWLSLRPPSSLSFSDSTPCTLHVYFGSPSSSPRAGVTSPWFSLSDSLSCLRLRMHVFLFLNLCHPRAHAHMSRCEI